MNISPMIDDSPSEVNGNLRRRERPRLWREKFAEACRGLKLGIRGHSSFFAHFFATVLAILAGIALGCKPLEWIILVGCIGLVLTAELFNSAIETLFHGLDDATKSRIRGCLDISAGAVLMASLTAGLVGAMIFVPRLWHLLTQS